MSDKEAIERFAGTFVSDGTTTNTDPSKAPWFPDEGVEMQITAKEDDQGWHGKVEILKGRDRLPHAELLEAARYSVFADSLLSTPIMLDPRLAAIEVLSLNERGNVVHTVIFSDGVVGAWICE